jgi:hypothetical protein
MDIFLGYAGVAIAFVIMMFVLLMIMIKANNISWKLKFVLIPFVMWYSVALYHVPQNFMGWPTEKWSIQNEVIILDYYIEEEKAIYFWVVDYNIKNMRALVDPRQAFYPFIDGTPRAYKIVYDSKTHKELVAAKRKLMALGRGSMRMNLDKLDGMSRFDGNTPLFKLFDPAEFLRKATEQ